jgi:hypothetical protein
MHFAEAYNLESVNRNKRSLRRRFVPCSLFLLCILATILVLYYPLWIDVGSFFKRSLDSEFVPTAEYILAHPIPTPEFIGGISPPIGTTIERTQEVCISILPGALSDSGDSNGELSRNVYGSLRIVINNQVIPLNAVGVQMVAILHNLGNGRFSGLVSACFTPELDTGLHLFRVEMRDSPLGIFGFGEYFSYSWVYQVR